ncbi:MAG: helix-turn-helix domain-containing protein [Mycobacterium sp.]
MLRSDARDNRDRILAAARDLISQRGLDVTMREIARRAQVGPATLYRRFPTKDHLLAAAFADQVQVCQQIVGDGCSDPDPWRGFSSIIERASILHGRHQGFVDALMSAHPQADTLSAHRATVLNKIAELSKRAKARGGLRPDFAINDLKFVMLAARGLAALPPLEREAAARRFAALAIDAFRASDRNADLLPIHLSHLTVGQIQSKRD